MRSYLLYIPSNTSYCGTRIRVTIYPNKGKAFIDYYEVSRSQAALFLSRFRDCLATNGIERI